MSDPFEEWKSARGKEPIPSSIPAGTAIGEYKVLGLIGRGGSAEVYSAAHVKLGATVAIKILHELTEQSRIRFDREAKILSGTTHPCFPQFKSYGEFESRPYIVTELLGPCVLPRTDKDAAKFLLKVLDGVGCLHRLGFVHRDIKPANILMRNGKEPVLTDFGLACPISAPRQIMGRISIVDGRPAGVGTPGYAAPEQFEGGEVSAATDVHAVGMLADECFGGKPPRCWRRIIRGAAQTIIRQRFASSEEMARAIERRHWRRNAALSVVSVAAILALAWGSVFFGGNYMFDRMLQREGRVAPPDRAYSIKQLNGMPLLSLEGLGMNGYFIQYDFESVLRGANEGFSPTVNILDQEYDYDDFEDFEFITKSQLTERGGTILRCEEVVSNQVLVVEATLPCTGGGKAHCYQRLVRHGERAYCITATDRVEDWEKHKAELKGCVDSFRIRGE